jgi:ADP-ribosylglycohydrolase
MDRSVEQRVLACLKGIATGDAIGKQTETLFGEDVLRWYPDGVHGFEGSPGTPIPRYVGNTKREWRVGETTDDTERTIAVARAIRQAGDVRHASVGRELLTCTKCVHPGIQSLWEFHQAGDPERMADRHDGCGAAVRVAPVGILYRSDRLEQIVAAAREASVPTHGGALAIAAAAATAAAVSAAIDGASSLDIIEIAQRAAALAERDRSGSAAAPFAEAIQSIHQDLHQWRDFRPAEVAARYFPKGALTIVPLALALGTVMLSAEAAILLATNIGGDSDSVASIAGALLGARYPDTVNDEWYEVVEVTHGKRTCVLLVTKTWDALLRAATVQVSSVVACKGWTAIARRGLRRRPRRSREHSKEKAVKVSLCVLPRKSRDPLHHSGPRVRDERTTVSDKAQ